MKNNQVLVYTTNKLFEAESIKGYLANENIVAFILNKMDSAYLFGEIEILVDQDDLIKAKKLIEDYLKNE